MGRRITRGSLYFASSLAAAILPAQAVADSDLAQPMLAQVAACVPPQAPASPATPNPPPLLVSGLGYAGIAPDTADAEARRWFEQGVRLIWAFDEVEAIRAFEQAQRIDPACALCAWGEAWARGPTINLQPRTEEHGKAAAASARAERLSGKLSRRDTQLIRAMQVRTGGAGKFRNKAYAKAMARLALRFPADDAAAVMAADAAMVAAPRRGLKEGSNAQRLLESVLRRNPDHSGAIHMYIHLTDWIDRQDLAERHADRLGRLAPAASHLVHMPSHTFYGVGRYADAAAVNVAALAADQAYEAKVKPPASDYRTGLYAHNSNFAIGGALMNGDGKTALKIADHFADRFRAKPDFGRGVRAAIYYAYGLYAAKADVLALPVPAGAALRAMRLYARGEAFARSGDAAAVRAEAAAIAALRASPEGRAFGGRPAEALVEIAQHVLEGRAAMMTGDHAAAAVAFRGAMTLQESSGFGFDPPPFWYPVRRSLGAALLAAGEHASAAAQFKASLDKWPNDPLALYALSRAQTAAGQQEAAAQSLARAKAGWFGSVEAVPLVRI